MTYQHLSATVRRFPTVVFALLLASCLPASAPPTLKLGLVAPFSGRDQALGYNLLFAAKMALREWNERGGVDGYYIELVAQDDSDGAQTGALQARKMALDPQVVGVIGHPSGESATAAAPTYRQAGLAVVTVGAALPDEKYSGPPVFQLGPTEPELAREATAFASAQGARRLALVAEAAPSAQSQALETGRAAQQAGLEVAFNGMLTPGGASPVGAVLEPPLLAVLKEARPDLVLYSGDYVGAGELLAGMRAQNLGTPFLGGPGLASPDFLKIAGPAAEGAYYQSVAPHPGDVAEARSFVEAYRALAGMDPRPQALLVYDGVNAMLEALSRGMEKGQKPGRGALWQELARGQYRGLSGPIAFDEQGRQLGARASIYHIEGLTWPGRLVPRQAD